MNTILLFRSLTYAQRALAILRRSGIPAVLGKPSTTLGRGSCIHGLKLGERYLPRAMSLLESAGLPIAGVYDLLPDGSYREVLW